MKTLNLKIRKYRIQILVIALLCFSNVFGYAQPKASKADMFYSKIVTLKPGMTKEEVKSIMGEPYKIAFTTNEKQELTEDMYYKTSVFIEKWYVITYQCTFENNKLKSLAQNELAFDTQNI